MRAPGPEDYVAFVGGLAEYKGIGHLLDFALAYPDYPIRVAGYPSSDFPIDWARYPSVKYVGYVPYSDLVALVSRASALLYLSYSEGFGLPMIEAQLLGVPLIVNPRNVMVRELLAKDSYVSAGNVASPTSIRAAIEVAKRDRDDLVRRGLANAAHFDETQQLTRLERAMSRAHERLRAEGWGK
jgi:glycosyltransferase involved in cell wall biosynthesis